MINNSEIIYLCENVGLQNSELDSQVTFETTQHQTVIVLVVMFG